MGFEIVLFFMMLFTIMIYNPILALIILIMAIIFVGCVAIVEILGNDVGLGNIGLGVGDMFRGREEDDTRPLLT